MNKLSILKVECFMLGMAGSLFALSLILFFIKRCLIKYYIRSLIAYDANRLTDKINLFHRDLKNIKRHMNGMQLDINEIYKDNA